MKELLEYVFISGKLENIEFESWYEDHKDEIDQILGNQILVKKETISDLLVNITNIQNFIKENWDKRV